MPYRLEVNSIPSQVQVGQEFNIDTTVVCFDNDDSVIIGNEAYATELTIILHNVNFKSDEIDIDMEVVAEKAGDSGRFNTGLDVMILDGGTVVDNEVISFTASKAQVFEEHRDGVQVNQKDSSFTATIPMPNLKNPCIKIGSVEGQERGDSQAQRVCWFGGPGNDPCEQAEYTITLKRAFGPFNIWDFPIISRFSTRTVFNRAIQLDEPGRDEAVGDATISISRPGKHKMILQLADIKKTKFLEVNP